MFKFNDMTWRNYARNDICFVTMLLAYNVLRRQTSMCKQPHATAPFPQSFLKAEYS